MSDKFNKYQLSLKKFIIGQSVLANYSLKDQIIRITNNNECILPITLLTIMSGQRRQNQLKQIHGYDMATGIELLMVLIDLLEFKKKIFTFPKILTSDPKYNSLFQNNTIDILQYSLTSLINLSLIKNLDLLRPHTHSNNMTDMFLVCSEQINDKLNKIISSILTLEIPDNLKNLSRTDLKTFHFPENYSFDDLLTIKRLPKDFLLKFITDTFGNACKLTLILGWILGGCQKDLLGNLDRIGYHFGIILKLAYDFSNIIEDMQTGIQNKLSFSYVINFGLQDAFELFDDSRCKFIEGILTIGITSSTIKELVDILANKVYTILDNTSPNIRRSSSTASFTSSNL